MLQFVYLALYSVAVFASPETRIVDLSYGSIRGKLVTSRRGQQGYAFLAIPMTEPPVGPLRFKKAVPIKPWNGTVDCLNYKYACPQQDRKIKNPNVTKSEDCLQNNVYTSRTCLEKGNCPVIAFIHGGAHLFVTPARTKEENLINNFANEERNVIFVSLPFRLGVFAWLHLAPQLKDSSDSNIQNRDMLFGLEWIQREIHKFGGDPRKVTLIGHSSGALSVVEIILTPLSAGLFHQAAQMSAPYSAGRNENVCSKYSQRFAIRANCASDGQQFSNVKTVEKILKCLRGKPWEELYAVQDSFENDVEQLDGVWVDGRSGVFSGDYPALLKQSLPKMNFMIGTTSAESKNTQEIVDPSGKINSTRLDEICTALAYEGNYETPEAFRKVCKERYGTIAKAADLGDDLAYYHPSSVFANKFSQSGDVFVYSFEYNYTAPKFTWKSVIVSPQHADDLKFFMWGDYDNFTEDDWQIEKIYSGLFVNFVKIGNPTYMGQDWKPWKRKDKNYFLIDFDEKLKMPGMTDGYHQDLAAFYDVLVPKIAGNSRPPVDLPPRHETYLHYTMIGSFASEWKNVSLLHLKTLGTCLEDERLWRGHIDHLKELSARRGGASFGGLKSN